MNPLFGLVFVTFLLLFAGAMTYTLWKWATYPAVSRPSGEHCCPRNCEFTEANVAFCEFTERPMTYVRAGRLFTSGLFWYRIALTAATTGWLAV
jgi:hypothetical protein